MMLDFIVRYPIIVPIYRTPICKVPISGYLAYVSDPNDVTCCLCSLQVACCSKQGPRDKKVKGKNILFKVGFEYKQDENISTRAICRHK